MNNQDHLRSRYLLLHKGEDNIKMVVLWLILQSTIFRLSSVTFQQPGKEHSPDARSNRDSHLFLWSPLKP